MGVRSGAVLTGNTCICHDAAPANRWALDGAGVPFISGRCFFWWLRLSTSQFKHNMLFATFCIFFAKRRGAGGGGGTLGRGGLRDVNPKARNNFQLAKSVDKSTDIAMQICHLKRTIDVIKPRQESVMDRHDKLGQQDHDTKKSHPVQNYAGYVAKSSLNTSTRDWTVLEQLLHRLACFGVRRHYNENAHATTSAHTRGSASSLQI